MPRRHLLEPLHPIHPRTMTEVGTGSRVVIRDAYGNYHDRIALTGIERGHDFLVVWVAREEVLATALARDSGSGAAPWPAEDVWLPGDEPRAVPEVPGA